MSTFDGTCPHCGKELQIDPAVKKISKKEHVSENFLNDALKKLADDKQKRKDQFERTQKDLSKRRQESDDLFKKGLDEIKEKGLGGKPIRDIDL